MDFCYEDWPIDHGGTLYSISTMVFQYFFPIVFLSFTNISICMKLRHRFMSRQVVSEQQKQKRRKEKHRMQRTNNLLISIACVFGLTWLPLNILNIVSDLIIFDSPEKFTIVFGCCLLLGITSACSNPIFYGWFNENFQKEFRKVICNGQHDRNLQSIEKTDIRHSKLPQNSNTTYL